MRPLPTPSGSRLQDRLGELVGIERAEVLQRLADPDQLDRDAELLGDRERDPALGRAVELRERDAGHVHRLAEQERLAETVLPGGGVYREERLVRRAGGLPLD